MYQYDAMLCSWSKQTKAVISNPRNTIMVEFDTVHGFVSMSKCKEVISSIL